MSFIYENFHWAKIDYPTLYGKHRYEVLVSPNQAKVIITATGRVHLVVTGENFEERAIAQAIELMRFWDNHRHCCWSVPPTYVLSAKSLAKLEEHSKLNQQVKPARGKRR